MSIIPEPGTPYTPSVPEHQLRSSRLLHIENRSPGSIYLEALRLTTVKDNFTHLLGEKIGTVKPSNPEHPLKSIETSVRGSLVHTQWEDHPDYPGSKRGVVEQVKEFGLETKYELPDHTYIDDGLASQLDARLMSEGYEVRREVHDNGFRTIIIVSPKGEFGLGIGFSDSQSYLSYKLKELEIYQEKYPTSVPYTQREINAIASGHDKSSIRLDIANSHPGFVPSGQPLKSKDEFIGYIETGRDVAEIVATVLTEGLGKGKRFDCLEMDWRSTKTIVPIWYEKGGVKTAEALLSFSITELNTTLVRVIQSLQMERNCPDLVNESGMDGDARQLLGAIEEYFDKNYPGQILPLEQLNEKERVFLALGLALKCTEKAMPIKNGSFLADDQSTIGGITFHRYGESQRDRFEFYQQQDRKFGYKRDTTEAADFFLPHTTIEGQNNELTRYERIQSANLAKARKWIRNDLEPTKVGNYDLADVQKINSMLLQELIPDRYLGMFRRTPNAMIQGRIGMPDPGSIEHNLRDLLKDIGDYIGESKTQTLDRDSVIERTTEAWACFDAIHPEEEGNGRTGTLLFESWYRILMGSKEQFESERKETWAMGRAMSEALKGNSSHSFFYKSSSPRLEGDLNPLIEYVKQHMVRVQS